jgi:pilus assembly protein CpaC
MRLDIFRRGNSVSPVCFLSGCAFFVMFISGYALGQQPQHAAQAAALRPAALTSAPVASADTHAAMQMLVGRSQEISSPDRIKTVSVADPQIVDVMVVSPYHVLVNAKSSGTSSIVVWDEAGFSHTYDVYVNLDVKELSEKIHAIFPNQDVRVEAQNDVVVLSGHVNSQAVGDKILDVAKAVAPKAVSLIQTNAPPATEVLLQVKFAEVDRTAIQQLGINILSLPGAKNIGVVGTQQFAPPQLPPAQPLTAQTGGFNLSDLLNIFVFRPDINLAATVKALQEKNILQILAEPNVMTQSGKEASFLAGGEFPYPVVQGSGSGLPTVTIQFREFGVRLDFTPTVMEDGLIHLKVKPEVSSLDFSNALTLQGFVVPALSTRRVESEMDLRDGQSFVIAGLVDNRVTDQLEKVPGLGDIPLLGKLFQSRSLNKSNNELIVLVTPRVVEPLPSGEQPTPPTLVEPFLPAAPEKHFPEPPHSGLKFPGAQKPKP